MRSTWIAVKLAGVFAAAQPFVLLPRHKARGATRDFLYNCRRHSRPSKRMSIRKRSIEPLCSGSVGNAPRTDGFFDVRFAVRAAGIYVAARFSTTNACRL